MTYCSGSNASKSIPTVLFSEILDIRAKSVALNSLINFSSCFTKSIQISGVLPFDLLLTRGFEFFPCLMEHCDLKRSEKKGEILIIFNQILFFSTVVYPLDILFSSNHNIHKSSHGLCFWASDSLIDRFFN